MRSLNVVLPVEWKGTPRSALNWLHAVILEDGPRLVWPTDGGESGIEELVSGRTIAWNKQARTWFNMDVTPTQFVFLNVPIVCGCGCCVPCGLWLVW